MYNACKKFQNMILYNQLRNMIRKILVIKMTTGERIKMLRKEHNLTQEELGAKIGVQKAAIQKYEKGTVKNIKRDSLIKLAQCLDTSPEYLSIKMTFAVTNHSFFSVLSVTVCIRFLWRATLCLSDVSHQLTVAVMRLL